MTRENLIEKLLWITPNSGWGFGLGGGLFQALSPSKRTIKSAVVIKQPESKYTDEELEKLLAFSEKVTEHHVKLLGSVLVSDNLIVIDKMEDGSWLRKARSWEMGEFFSPTLDEAIEFIIKNRIGPN